MHDQNPNIAAKISRKSGRRTTEAPSAREPLAERELLSERQPLSGRVLDLGRRIWRPAGTLVAFALALLLTWHVINGKHGLNVWLEKRAEDKVLQREIRDLNQENDRLRDRIEHLKTDPDTIMIAARQTLHYAKPDEVIVALPADKSQDKTQPAADQKK
jgi:cell division protein FtsB